jgi:hypothetical protein
MNEAADVVQMFRDHYNIPSSWWMPPTLHLAAGRRGRPGDQAQDHRPAVHRGLRGRGPQDRRRGFPRPGHALPGRHRKRFILRRSIGDDQVTPQCRRSARTHEHAAGRALARTVQGRGEGAGPRARPADSFIGRHPFPGPGLAIRCPGGITREKLDILRQADAIYLDEIRKAGLYDTIWQAFAVLLPVQTVGVMGDGRTYEFVCALRAVTSVDGMTADFYPYDMDFLGRPPPASSTRSRASTASSMT